ncbi:MAG: arginine--tRNA ligase [Bacteroidia bacterium]
MLFADELKSDILKAVKAIYDSDFPTGKISLQPTKKEFAGDATLVVFPFLQISKQSPEQTANAIGEWMKNNSSLIEDVNVIKGFLNLSIKQNLFIDAFTKQQATNNKQQTTNTTLVEYSSPNTNKPLHLGHMRNILLGYAVSEILKANGNKVYKVNIVNDRGIHICKSMQAWLQFGNGETPQSSGMKGDHLVGKYYVEFDKAYNAEAKAMMSDWISGKFESPESEAKYKSLIEQLESATSEEAKDKIIAEIKAYAKSVTPIFKAVQQMLLKWEASDLGTLELWNKMNGWVYDGFDVTYKMLGVDFDKIYYESKTYLLGKEIVAEGLSKEVFYKKPDGSVWVDLTAEGLDHKLLLRGDGTSVYITQDLGTAKLRYDDYHFDKLIYVVGNEQEYHFKVLKQTLKKLGYDWWDSLYHLAYNMVDLPSGKMKSREGTVVDADDLIGSTIEDSEKMTRELGKLGDFDSDDAKNLYRIIGLGALKYFILKVDPEKRMLFNPAESIDINGNTGPFIQYAYARIQSVLRKANSIAELSSSAHQLEVSEINAKEKDLIKLVLSYNEIIAEAAHRLSPALIANYAYDLAKAYNQFYHDNVVVDATDISRSLFRIELSKQTAMAIGKSFSLLGIEVPERM